MFIPYFRPRLHRWLSLVGRRVLLGRRGRGSRCSLGLWSRRLGIVVHVVHIEKYAAGDHANKRYGQQPGVGVGPWLGLRQWIGKASSTSCGSHVLAPPPSCVENLFDKCHVGWDESSSPTSA